MSSTVLNTPVIARARRPILFALFFVSGFSGLVYESIWTHYLKLFLGHAAYAQTLVLAMFMGGMAIGAWLVSVLGQRIGNFLRGYALMEALVGLAALGFHALFVATTDSAYQTWLPMMGSPEGASALKWLISAALILPQSVLLGMTFPLMSGGLLRRHPERPGEAVAFLYFSNSLGAAIGILLSGFVLVNWLGLAATMTLAGTINLVLAAIVWLLAPGRDPQPVVHTDSASDAPSLPVGLLLLVAALTGTASFIYEIVWIRMLALVLGASTHSFELMLSAFILGLALGGWWIRRRIDRLHRPLIFLAGVQVIMGLAAIATIPLYDAMFEVMQALVAGLAKTDTGYRLFLAGSHAIALAVMIPATFCAGMTLPLITTVLFKTSQGERAIGRVYAANTLGSIVGVWLAAHWLVPAFGLKNALLVGASLDVLLGLVLLYRFSLTRRAPNLVGLVATGVFCVIGLGAALDPYRMASGVYRRGEIFGSGEATLEFYKDGKTTSVALLRFGDGLSLRTNGKSDGAINMNPDGERISDEQTMVLTAAIPLAVKPDATEVAVIGIGTGLTTHTLLASPTLTRVDTIEIEPAMAEAARAFAPRNTNAYVDPRSNIVFDDAKTYFSTHNRRYDIIISEPSNPWVSGVSSLFTGEFYRQVRRHLKPEGVLVQWFQMYEIEPALVASVLRALGAAFPDYVIYAATATDLLIIAGASETLNRPLNDVFAQPGLATELRRVQVGTLGDIALRRLGNKHTLAPLFDGYDVPANSDYFPFLDANAARHRFLQSSARELNQLGSDSLPVIEVLEGAPRPPHALSYEGESFLTQMETARRARYALNFVSNRNPEPRAIPTQFQKDLELLQMRAIDCRDPERYDIWLHSALQVARTVNVGLGSADANAFWAHLTQAPCAARLAPQDKRWLLLHTAAGARDPGGMREHASWLLANGREISAAQRQYLLTAALTGAIALKDFDAAVALWNAHIDQVARNGLDMNLRLLHGQMAAAGRTKSGAPVN